jgi:hypothetical protein
MALGFAWFIVLPQPLRAATRVMATVKVLRGPDPEACIAQVDDPRFVNALVDWLLERRDTATLEALFHVTPPGHRPEDDPESEGTRNVVARSEPCAADPAFVRRWYATTPIVRGGRVVQRAMPVFGSKYVGTRHRDPCCYLWHAPTDRLFNIEFYDNDAAVHPRVVEFFEATHRSRLYPVRGTRVVEVDAEELAREQSQQAAEVRAAVEDMRAQSGGSEALADSL